MGCGNALWLCFGGHRNFCAWLLNAVGHMSMRTIPGVFSRRWQWELRQDVYRNGLPRFPQTKGRRAVVSKRSMLLFLAERDSAAAPIGSRARVPSSHRVRRSSRTPKQTDAQCRVTSCSVSSAFIRHLSASGRICIEWESGMCVGRRRGRCGIFTPALRVLRGDCDGRQSRSDVDRLARHPAVLTAFGIVSVGPENASKEPAPVPSLFWCL